MILVIVDDIFTSVRATLPLQAGWEAHGGKVRDSGKADGGGKVHDGVDGPSLNATWGSTNKVSKCMQV